MRNENEIDLVDVFERMLLSTVDIPKYQPAIDAIRDRLRQPVHVTAQQIVDAGLNVFGLQLFLESISNHFTPPQNNQPLEFKFTHRGTVSFLTITLEAVTAVRDQSVTELALTPPTATEKIAAAMEK